jgi:hypothetical protein
MNGLQFHALRTALEAERYCAAVTRKNLQESGHTKEYLKAHSYWRSLHKLCEAIEQTKTIEKES